MKKSSIIVTLLLVVALLFTVSCPSKDIVTLKLTQPTNGEVTANDTNTTIKVTLSTTGEFTDKLTKDVIQISPAEAFGKDANVPTISDKAITVAADKKSADFSFKFVGKVPMDKAAAITLTIPEVKAAADAYIKEHTAAVTLSFDLKVVAAKSKKDIKFNPVADITTGDSFNIVLTEGAVFKDTIDSAKYTVEKTSAAEATNPIIVSIVATGTDKKTATVRFNTAVTTVNNGEYTLDITNAITLTEGYQAVKVPFKVAVAKTEIKMPEATGGPISFTSAVADTTGKTVTYTFPEGVTLKNADTNVTIARKTGQSTAITATKSASGNTLSVTFTATDSVSPSDAGEYTVTIKPAAFDDVDTTKFTKPTSDLTAEITVNVSAS